MSIEGKNCWLNHLDAGLVKYYNRVHRAIHKTPFEANDKLIPNVLPGNNKFPIFRRGVYVRVPDKRNIYSEAYTTNWNRELFEKIKLFQLTSVLIL